MVTWLTNQSIKRRDWGYLAGRQKAILRGRGLKALENEKKTYSRSESQNENQHHQNNPGMC